MYNYFMLIGIITDDIELRDVGEGKRVVNLTLAVQRDFKNMDGEYSYDYIRVSLWDFLADAAMDNLKKGKKIGVKGRIYPRKEPHEKGFKIPVNDLTVDRLIYFDDYTGEGELPTVESEE